MHKFYCNECKLNKSFYSVKWTLNYYNKKWTQKILFNYFSCDILVEFFHSAVDCFVCISNEESFRAEKKILARCDWITNYNVFRKKKMKKSANKNGNENVHERRITEKMSTEQTTLTQRKSNRTQCTLNAELHLYILHWFGWQ